jgi:LCP family protein required for cell wall assembly
MRRMKSTPRRRAQKRRLRWLLLLGVITILCLSSILVYGIWLTRSSTNILILGIDRRPEQGNAVRTDTILLLHAAPSQRRLAVLSIPRDLWVEIPGRGQDRINTAHIYGELTAPGSGPLLTAETVQNNFGIVVDHYLRLDFDAFKDVVDAAGGIDIDVPNPIIDNAYPTDDYGTVRIEIPAGLQHMDGTVALQYARSRHGSSDFDRATRQQQILIALAKKLISPSGWRLIPSVYRTFQTAVESDASFPDLIGLALAWQRTGEAKMEQFVIDRQLTTPFQTAQGAAVLLPRWELIRPLVQTEFYR